MKTIILSLLLLFIFGYSNIQSNGNIKNQAIPLDGRGGGYIAFQTERHGEKEVLYIMNADGTAQTRLTNNSGSNVCPALSPDSRQIAFSSDRTGDYEIYVMNIDGSNEQRITDSPGFDLHPSWSPDGTKIVFMTARDGNYEIYTMNNDGSNQMRLTDNTWNDELPDWSPDGNSILFSSQQTGNYGIFMMNKDGSTIRSVLNTNVHELDGRWSPDGKEILFTRMALDYGQRQVYRVSTDGSNPAQLTINNSVNEDARWSPDGSKIVFQSDRSGSFQLYTMNADGSNLTKISTVQGDYWPSWGRSNSQTGIVENDNRYGRGSELYQNYPNPVIDKTTFSFSLARPDKVCLYLMDMSGKLVTKLVEETLDRGVYTYEKDLTCISPGQYIYKLVSGSGHFTKILTILRP
ncbi:MAG: DUF5050 domain-containing protein [Bacteroidota bacterium]